MMDWRPVQNLLKLKPTEGKTMDRFHFRLLPFVVCLHPVAYTVYYKLLRHLSCEFLKGT